MRMDKAVATYIRERGLDAVLKEMPKQTRYRWMKKLGVEAAGRGRAVQVLRQRRMHPGPHPADVFNDQYQEVLRQSLPLVLQ
jgi:hypothetical protein